MFQLKKEIEKKLNLKEKKRKKQWQNGVVIQTVFDQNDIIAQNIIIAQTASLLKTPLFAPERLIFAPNG